MTETDQKIKMLGVDLVANFYPEDAALGSKVRTVAHAYLALLAKEAAAGVPACPECGCRTKLLNSQGWKGDDRPMMSMQTGQPWKNWHCDACGANFDQAVVFGVPTHFCVRCHRKWDGNFGPTEYCGDCHREFQALQAKEAARGDWQPIATAPKDGTHILLYQPDGMWFKRGRHRGESVERAYWHQPGNPNVEGFWVPATRPTHWMPLPAKPETQD